MSEIKNLSIKQWAEQDRPREKLLKKGISSLSDAELLAILISTGTKQLSAVDLAKIVLNNSQNNLNILGKKTIAELTKINGIGEAKAITIMAALELGRRRKNADLEQVALKNSAVIFDIMQPILGDSPHEEFWVLYLNNSLKLIEKQQISSGGLTRTVIDTRIILKHAINNLAMGMVLVHNHPSGNINPSTEDITMTERIKQASQILDIQVLDHIIIANNKFYSFADNGKI